MPRTRSKVAEKPEGDEGDSTGEGRDDISLISWLDLYQGFITDTADLLKDEINNIKTRKIARNAVTLKNEKKPETVRLGKNIVTGFNDAISKAIKDLQNYGTQMSEELQKRFNLPDDWMQSTSTTVSVTGSEVSGPTFRKRKEMENNRIGLFFNSTETSDGMVPETSLGGENSKKSNGPSELPDESENDKSNDACVEESVSDENGTDTHQSKSKAGKRESPRKSKTTRESPKKSTPRKVSESEQEDGNADDEVGDKSEEEKDGDKSEDEKDGDKSENELDGANDRLEEEIEVGGAKPGEEIGDKSNEEKNGDKPEEEKEADKAEEEEDVDMIPGSEDEDADEEEKKSTQLPSSPKSERYGLRRVKQEKITECETPKKSTQESSGSGSSKKKETPKRSLSTRSCKDSDTDSDGSGKTCIVPTKKNSTPTKLVDPIVVKKERKSEGSKSEKPQNSSAIEGSSDSTSPRKSTRSLVKREAQDDENEAEGADDNHMEVDEHQRDGSVLREDPLDDENNAEALGDDLMDFLSPARDDVDVDDFGVDPDETMTVAIPRTPLKHKDISNDSALSESALDQTKKKDEKEDQSDPNPSDSNKNDDNKSTKKKRTEKSNKKSKEELEAMKDILASSSSDSESESSKNKKEKKRPPKREKKVSEEKDGESSAKKSTKLTGKFWKDDPKLETTAAYVQLEKLPASVEKSLTNEGFVKLKNYTKMKKCSLDQLIKSDGSATSDSDSSTASVDSLQELEKQLKKLSRNSIIRTKKYREKKKEAGNILEKKSRQARRKPRGTDESLESSDSDASSDHEEKRSKLKGPIIPDDDIVSCSGSEDIDADSDESTNKKKATRSNPSRNPDKKGKTYARATITSSDSDSEKENMKAVLGTDSDSDKNKKRSTRSKKARDSSGSDSDFVTVKKRTAAKKKKETDSDASLISIKSEDSSDSEDSDFVKSKKSTKRRRNSSSSEENKKRKKKRKRIVTNDSDDSDKKDSNDSDIEEIPQDEEPSSSQKGRKNIRKIMSTEELAKTTKRAEREEEERRKRLSEKQKLFNGIHKAPESDKLERLILDVDPETKEPLIEVDESIVRQLKPHQAEGIKFMYNACFESVDMIKQNKVPGGCILAHCMGLGKTLQSIAFVHTLLTNEICGIKTALVICPLSTVNNWYNEFRSWTEDAADIRLHKLYEAKNSVASRIDHLKTWQRRGGVGLLHYDIFRRLADPKGKSKMKASLKTVIQQTLLDPGPDIVICDEGHLLKNWKSMLSLSVNNIRTHRRIVLTGTPLQNNLVEYHTMMNFVKPNLLGSLPEFTNRFVNPIKNGQHADSTDGDVKTMKRRAHVLHRKLEGCVQRCDYSILAPYLPPKYEYILKIKLSEKQEKLYKHYLGNVVDSDPLARRRNLLKYYAELVKIWSHPIALTMRRSKDKEDEETSEDDSIKDFIKDDSTTSSESDGEGSSDSLKKKGTHSKRKTRAQAANDPEPDKPITLDDALQGLGNGWWNAVYKKAEMEDCSISGKLVILQEILKTSETIGDKVLVFSQYLTSLDIIEEFLRDWDQESEKQQKEKDEPLTFPLSSTPQLGRWRRNIEYFRIDGQTKVQDRQRDCEKFNRKSSLTKAKLFLISTRAGGLGINLYGANRVVIFDASWNPSQDMQSIFRVYRFGQDKPCYIYRLIAQGTMEEKILRRQITKLSLSSRVIDEHQIERHFKFDDVNEMYVYDEEDPSRKDAVLAVPKDRLLADLLMSHPEWIRSYEEFDSLLENKTDDALSNEEKELAWEEYRIESERQRQFNNSSHTTAVNEAATYIKVKSRLQANYPTATEEQVENSTRISLDVIEKIRRLMLIQNTGVSMAHLLDPLKLWLQVAVSPREGPLLPPPGPPGASILPDLPAAYYQNPGPIQQYAPRMQMPNILQGVRPRFAPANAGPPPQLLQHMSNNFRNIASSTLAGMRNLANPHMQMNGHARYQ